LIDHDGTVAFNALWTPYAPRAAILSAVLPLAGALMALICALMIFMLSRHRNTFDALAESEARNRFLANHDALTGLANRGQLDQRFETLFRGDSQSSFAVMCIDLDSFKAVNDNHGHHAGDLVLQTVARRFAERIGDAGMVARVGGDEFIALITMNTEAEVLRMLASGITSDAATPVTFGSLTLQIGASVGVAVFPLDGRKSRELIAAADAALYESKRNGRGCVTFADRDNVCQLSAYQGRERRIAPTA
jgi:diguanylate cyclase (GGDEF)-like protein